MSLLMEMQLLDAMLTYLTLYAVYSSHLHWEPQGEQLERFKNDPIRPVIPDILITKMRPGQVLSLR